MSFRVVRSEQQIDRGPEVKHQLRLDVQRIEMGAVGPAPGRWQAVELRFVIESVAPPCILQLENRRTVQQLIDGLVELRDAVWPQGG